MLSISSKFHSYTVEPAQSLDEVITGRCPPGQTFILVDRNVQQLYPSAFSDGVATNRIFSIEATEEQKSYEQLTPLFTQLLETGFRKDCILLVIGGGVLQDIGCFIASVLFRGVRWELVPTTLLAQCDSCIGSKSSINIGAFKNQIGTFYPPHRIHMISDILQTLPPDEIRSGLGEIIKLFIVAGGAAFDGLAQRLDDFEDPGVLQELIHESLRIKKRYIEQDELDKGVRNLLNYGHTFGHAYESATNYAIPHGIAVTLGIATATYFSEQLGMVENGSYRAMVRMLYPFFAPYHEHLLAAEPERILKAMKLDKKNTGSVINCILTEGPGALKKVPLSLDEQVAPMMSGFLANLST